MYTTCQMLNNSPSLDDNARFEKWFEFMGMARTFLPAEQKSDAGDKSDHSEHDRDLANSNEYQPNLKASYTILINNTLYEITGNDNFRFNEKFNPDKSLVNGRGKKLDFESNEMLITDVYLNGKYTIYGVGEWSGSCT